MDGFDRNRLVQLADRVPDEAIPAATRYLEYLADRGDPFVRHLFEAPEEEEALGEAGQRLGFLAKRSKISTLAVCAEVTN